MTAFADAATLSSFLGMSDVDTARADVLLSLASDAIRAHTQQRLDYVEHDTVLLDPEPSLVTAFLPELPIVSVESVEQLGRDGTWRALTLDQYDWTSAGVLYHRLVGTSRFSARRRSLRVVYSHGYQDVPSDLAGVAVSVAARLYENPLGATQTRLGTFSEQFGTSRQPGIDFTDLEEQILAKYAMTRVG